MLQDGQVTSALVAAISKMQKAYYLSDISARRRKNILGPNNYFLSFSSCCSDEDSLPKSIPVYRPFLRTPHGEIDFSYVAVPFVYCAWKVVQGGLSYLEILEVPWHRPCEPFEFKSHAEFLKFEKSHELEYEILMMSAANSSRRLTSGDLWRIRKQSLSLIFDLAKRSGHIYFSVLKHYSAQKNFSDPLLLSYFKSLEESSLGSPYELHINRAFPVEVSKKLHVFDIDTFVVSRAEMIKPI